MEEPYKIIKDYYNNYEKYYEIFFDKFYEKNKSEIDRIEQLEEDCYFLYLRLQNISKIIIDDFTSIISFNDF